MRAADAEQVPGKFALFCRYTAAYISALALGGLSG